MRSRDAHHPPPSVPSSSSLPVSATSTEPSGFRHLSSSPAWPLPCTSSAEGLFLGCSATSEHTLPLMLRRHPVIQLGAPSREHVIMSYLGLVMTAPCHRAGSCPAQLPRTFPWEGTNLLSPDWMQFCTAPPWRPQKWAPTSSSLGEPEGSLCSALLFAMSHPPPPGLFLAEWES